MSIFKTTCRSGWQSSSDKVHLYCEASKALDALTETSLFEGQHWRPALIIVIKTKHINNTHLLLNVAELISISRR